MNNKGFTLVELIIVIAIIAILGLIAFGNFDESQGAEYRTFTAQLATGEAIQATIEVLKEDPDLSVVVMNYRSTWNRDQWDKIDESIEEGLAVVNKFLAAGIFQRRVIIGMSNQGNSFIDNNPHIKENGTYLLLTYR